MDKFLIFLIQLYIFIILHEMGHYLYCIFKGIPVKYLYIMPFEFFFIKKKIGFRLNFSYAGLVVLDIKRLKDRNIDSLRENMCSYILMGPVVNIISCIVLGIMVLKVEATDELVCAIVINIFMVITCFSKNSNALGDFFAYSAIKKNDIYFWQQLYSCIRFGNVPYEKQDIDLIVNRSVDLFNDNSDSDISRRIMLFLLEHKLKNPDCDIKSVEESINNQYSKYMEQLYKVNSAIDIVIIGRLIQYIYIIEKDVKKAKVLFDKYKNDVPKNYIFEECYWMLENKDRPDGFIDKCLNKEYAKNYYMDECIIVENIGVAKSEML